ALDHRKPDRLPRYEVFFSSFIEQWVAVRGLPADVNIHESYQIDIPRVLACQAGPFWRAARTDDQGEPNYTVLDTWGRRLRRRRDSGFYELLQSAIQEKGDIERVNWTDVDDLVQSSVTDEIDQCAHDARFAPVTGVMGLFHACTYLRGEIAFMMDLLDDEAFCDALVDQLRLFLTNLGLQMLEATGTWDTAIWVYDDFSIKTGPLISPALFEQRLLPAYRAMFAEWKARGARHIVLHHDVMSENSYPIIDMLVDAGLDGVQGVYPTDGLTVMACKQRYGNRLSVIGGMCNTQTLPFGSRSEIEREATLVAEAGRDGGVIIGSHSIEGYIPVENYDWFQRALEKIYDHW
ncbi:MAG TPA: uroporphyrinogen decarboxylase family protein, partial [Armatimonadota bacterium]